MGCLCCLQLLHLMACPAPYWTTLCERDPWRLIQLASVSISQFVHRSVSQRVWNLVSGLLAAMEVKLGIDASVSKCHVVEALSRPSLSALSLSSMSSLTLSWHPSSHTWPARISEAKEFVYNLLRRDPRSRWNAEQALASRWIQRFALGGGEATLPPDKPIRTRLVSSMRNYESYGVLRRIVLMVVAYFQSSEELGPLRREFVDFDTVRLVRGLSPDVSRCILVPSVLSSAMAV